LKIRMILHLSGLPKTSNTYNAKNSPLLKSIIEAFNPLGPLEIQGTFFTSPKIKFANNSRI
ncbi:hypothetical protein, partial [Bacillus subtilis]|uniref:hypothetical protein n=1 Tax=Bacillus subtilis TaxID=1423 RepID=UPI00301C1847